MKRLFTLLIGLIAIVGTVGATNYTVTFINGKGWSNVNAYLWNNSNDSQNNSNYPGVAMTKSTTTTVINGITLDVYTYSITSDYTFDKIIFNDGSSQTSNIDFTNGMSYTAYADRTLYLPNSLNSYSTSDANYQSNGVWDATNSQDVFQFTINGADITGDHFYFRPKASDKDYQICPSGSTYKFTFTNGKWSSYDGYDNNDNYKGTNNSFDIEHSSIKASQYIITVYIKYNDWGWQYTTKAEIDKMPLEIKADEGKATFSCDRALDFSNTGVNAYAITAASDGTLTKSSALTTVPANAGLYIEGTKGTYDIPVIETANASDIGTNMMTPGTGASVSQISGDYTNFILTNKTVDGTAELKFYKVNSAGNTVGKGKAYLQIPTASVGARESFWFDDDETTSINFNANDNLNSDAPMFNLAGQRVANGYKGVVIQNGKKFIIK